MRRWWGLGAGLAALGVLAWLVFSAPSAMERGSRETSRPTNLQTSSAHRSVLQTASSTQELESERLAIRGTVLGPKGPISGARVLATVAVPGETLSAMPCAKNSRQGLRGCLFDSSELRISEWVEQRHGEALVRATTSTATDGTFTLSDLEAGTYAVWVESAEGIGFRPEVAAGSSSVELRVGEGVRLSGTVTDDAKVPVPGALVTVVFGAHSRFFEALTDATGHFQLGPMPPGDLVVVIAKKGLLTALDSITAYSSELTMDFMLVRPRSIHGQVLRSKVPVAGVEVRAASLSEQEFTTTTDAEGRFSFEEMTPETYELSAWHSGLGASQKLLLENITDGANIILELQPAAFIEGVVFNESHQPLEQAELQIWPSEVREGPEEIPEEQGTPPAELNGPSFAHTDKAGHYRLGPLRPGTYDLQVSAQGYLEQAEESREFPTGQTARDFTLRSALIVEGVLVDASGLPVPEEDVELHSIGAADPQWAQDRTREDGHFSLSVTEPGEFKLTLKGQQVHPQELTLTVPTGPLRIVGERLLQVSGEVVNSSGMPLPGVDVGIWAAGEGGKWLDRNYTDGLGQFTLHVPTPGRYVVLAELFLGTSVRSISQEVEVSGRDESRLRLSLDEGHGMPGIVVDWRGQPVPKVRLQLVSAPRTLIASGCRIPQLCAETGDDGRFLFREVSGEQFDVCVRQDGYSPLAAVHGGSSCVRVKNDGQEVRIVIGRDVFVTGRVVHPDGSPVTQFRVNGREVKREDGEISVMIHQPGMEQIELSAPGLQTVRRTAPEFPEGVQIQDLGTIVLSP